jgi:hypothetical protein
VGKLAGDELISFLGTGDYRVANYFISGDESNLFSTKYAPIAIAKLTNIEKIILLLTKESKKVHLEEFSREADNLCIEVEYRDIPEGVTEEERWQIWDEVVSCTEERGKISFDITHSYRLIPFYVFFTIEFLQNIRGMKLGGLYYGLYDKNKEKHPIINLSEILDILSWINFSSFFVKTGIFPKEAKELVRNVHARAYKINSSLKPKILQKIAGNFESISSSLNLVQEINIDKHTTDLIKNLENEADLVEEANCLAKPFEKIFEKVKDEYKSLILDEQCVDFVYANRAIVKAQWCLRHGLFTQSILLLREALINAFIEDKSELINRDKREKFFKACIALSNNNRNKENKFFTAIDKVTNLRNLVAHCGYNENSLNETNIEKNIEELISFIKSAICEDNIRGVKDLLNRQTIEIDLSKLYKDVAKVDEIELYKNKALEIAGTGNNIVLTGNAPVWMYLYIAHALHGKAKSLTYSSPVLKEFAIFDHNPY